MIFYVFFETDGDFGRYRMTRGFTTAALRDEWVARELALLAGRDDEDLSDLEEWESPVGDPTWAHIPINE